MPSPRFRSACRRRLSWSDSCVFAVFGRRLKSPGGKGSIIFTCDLLDMFFVFIDEYGFFSAFMTCWNVVQYEMVAACWAPGSKCGRNYPLYVGKWFWAVSLGCVHCNFSILTWRIGPTPDKKYLEILQGGFWMDDTGWLFSPCIRGAKKRPLFKMLVHDMLLC